MIQNDQKWFKTIKNDQKWFKTIKMIQNDKKWFKTIKNDLKWPKVTQYDQKWFIFFKECAVDDDDQPEDYLKSSRLRPSTSPQRTPSSDSTQRGFSSLGNFHLLTST